MLALPTVLDQYKPDVKFFVVAVRKHSAHQTSIDIVITVSKDTPQWKRRALRKHVNAIMRVQDAWLIASDFGLQVDPMTPPQFYVDIKNATDGPQ